MHGHRISRLRRTASELRAPRKALSQIWYHTFDPAAALPFVGETLQNCRRAVEGSGATVLGFVGAPFTLASYLVEGGTGVRSGFAQTRTMREESPELLHRILDVLATRIGEYLCYQIDSGAQVVQCFDSWAGHLDPEAFDEFAAPYLRRVVEVVKRERPGTPTIVYIAPAEHSRNGALLDRLAATGADIVGIDHTTDLAEARAALGPSIGTQGNLDPDLLRNGPIDAIEIGMSRTGGRFMNLRGLPSPVPP